MFTDPRTWSTLFYMLLMQPLGVLYFTLAVIGLAVSLAVAALPFVQAFTDESLWWFGEPLVLPMWTAPLSIVAGLLLLVLTMHGARGIGRLHAGLAKHLLVKSAA
jgi:hypothetical protein